ncbi:MAG: GAF domain-containing protein, partial [Alphaproteobacteria bacterium]|nr:GAF domain-containing protein [Alphaproteobacteria bacterium]
MSKPPGLGTLSKEFSPEEPTVPETASYQDHLPRLIELGIALSAERDHDRLLERILLEAKGMTNADGGTLYLRTEDDCLAFEILRNDTLKTAMGGTTGVKIPFPPLKLYNPDTGEPNHNNVATHTALSGERVEIADAYDAKDFDFSGTKKFDAGTGYRSKSFLTVPLKNYHGEV